MTAAKNQPTEASDDRRAERPMVGERHPPYNGGDLGYTYTIYRFYDADDRLLYLGETARIRQRIVDLELGHPRGLPLGHDDGPKPWWREATRIELEHLPPGTTETEAMAEERRQIEEYRPAYNREGNEEFFDRSRHDRAIDGAHFEVDVATAEHERHDGVVRPMDQIRVESARAANRLRPGGGALLGRASLRRQAWAGAGRPNGSSPVNGRSGNHRATFYPGEEQKQPGPGSLAGLLVVAAILLVAVAAALIVSLRVVL